ncbi:GFA family protein [Microbacterium sp. 18062]|uniref:GFA family protein n=1 Tax=Microbacterium sp. 18062 TaxID=2681410 RepID=UPI0013570C4A|nr:GFA family protein [Microbacterium sp. 18062]
MTMFRRGTCLCGRVDVTLEGEPLAIVACHCAHCRTQGGTALSLVAVMPQDAVRIAGALTDYPDTGGSTRRFCGACGTPVETVSLGTRREGTRVVKLGLFDGVDLLPPVVETFGRERAAWLPPFEGTAVFETMPGLDGEEAGRDLDHCGADAA